MSRAVDARGALPHEVWREARGWIGPRAKGLRAEVRRAWPELADALDADMARPEQITAPDLTPGVKATRTITAKDLPVGVADVARALELPSDQVRKWLSYARRTGRLPARWTVNGAPVWRWREVVEWLVETGKVKVVPAPPAPEVPRFDGVRREWMPEQPPEGVVTSSMLADLFGVTKRQVHRWKGDEGWPAPVWGGRGGMLGWRLEDVQVWRRTRGLDGDVEGPGGGV